MKKENKTSNALSFDFQIKLAKLIIEDYKFYKIIKDCFNPNMFDYEGQRYEGANHTYVRRIIGEVIDWYNSKNEPISYDELKLIFSRKSYENDWDYEMFNQGIEFIQKNVTTEGFDIVREGTLQYLKDKMMIKIAGEIQTNITSGKLDFHQKIYDLIEKTKKLTFKSKTLSPAFEEHDAIEDFKAEAEDIIPTGFDALDIRLGGGIKKRDLGIIISPSGCGKTSVTTGFATHAAANGRKVIHIFFEDDERAIRKKRYGWITDIDPLMLCGDYSSIVELLNGKYKDLQEKINNNIRQGQLKDSETTIDEIEAIIDEESEDGFVADLLIIDYFECIKADNSRGTENQWQAESKLIKRIKSLATEKNIAVWCPVQSTKDSIEKTKLGLNAGGGSVGKVQTANIVLTLSRTMDQEDPQSMTVHIAKCRQGTVGKSTLLTKFNNGTCKFKLDESSPIDIPQIEKDRDSIAKEIIKNRKIKNNN